MRQWNYAMFGWEEMEKIGELTFSSRGNRIYRGEVLIFSTKQTEIYL